MRRPRISLRVLLFFFSLAAVLLAVVGSKIVQAEKQRQLKALAEKYGGEPYDESYFENGNERSIRFGSFAAPSTLPGPDWLRRRIGDEYFVEVVEVLFDPGSSRVLNDATFAEFCDAIRSQNLPRPKGLVFEDLPISDTSLAELAAFPNLTWLHLHSCPGVTDEGLKFVGELHHLRILNLHRCSITNRGVAELAQLYELRELSLAQTSVTDEGLQHLKGLKRLEYLSLSGTSVSSAGRKELKKHIPNCSITW